MRQYVRAWINEWDLVRLDPTHEAAPEVVELATSYDELDDGAGSHCCGGWGVGCVWGRREVGLGVCVGSAVGGDPGPRCEGGSAVGLIRPCRAEGWVACRRREDAGEVSRMLAWLRGDLEQGHGAVRGELLPSSPWVACTVCAVAAWFLPG